MTYLEYRDEQSEKFWQINIEGCSHTVTFGRIGTKGQSKTKSFASEEECEKDAAKLPPDAPANIWVLPVRARITPDLADWVIRKLGLQAA